MLAEELEVGQLFFIKDHVLGAKFALVCDEIEESGVRVHLEGLNDVQAILEPHTEVLRIFIL